METQPVKVRKHRHFPTLIIQIIIAILTVTAALVSYTLVRAITTTWSVTHLPGDPLLSADPLSFTYPTPEPIQMGSGTVIPTQKINPIIQPTPIQWDGSKRVTVLLLGLDYRDWQTGDTPRSDSMILLTVDPLSKTAGMLSIPRDMWTVIPGFDYYKINTAYFLGERYQMPGGGPELARQTVENFIGVPIDYYAQIDFNTFAKFIDSMGGLDMKIKKAIKVDPVGPGNTIILEPGTQTLSGAVALAYARNRYTEYDDFDRAARQQEVMMAIRNQVVNLNMLPTMVSKAPELYAELSTGIRTNMTLDQIIRMANLAQQIPVENITKGVIDTHMVSFAKSPDGLDILVPNPQKIHELRDSIFASSTISEGKQIYGDDWVTILKEEGARVEISDASRVDGLGEKTAEFLRQKGINVTNVYPSTGSSTVSYVKSYTGMVYTTRYLADLFEVDGYRIETKYIPDSPMDITLMIGKDWAKKGLVQ
jgi:polyisoprenyl-teichoic acid--peptidoglycan teichoic acid transferase